MRNGGEVVTVASCFLTHKAWEGYRELNGDEGITREMVAQALVGVIVSRMADDSKFWLYRNGIAMYVMLVATGHTLADGKFAVVDVKENWCKEGE